MWIKQYNFKLVKIQTIKKITKLNTSFDDWINSSISYNGEKENEWLILKYIFDELLSKNYIDFKIWYQCIIISRLNLELPIISKGIISVKI